MKANNVGWALLGRLDTVYLSLQRWVCFSVVAEALLSPGVGVGVVEGLGLGV